MLREPGPATARIWQAVPFLERVSAADLAAPEEASCRRRVAGARPCLLCGGGSCGALIVRPRLDGWPVWADLCAGCFDVVRAEGGS